MLGRRHGRRTGVAVGKRDGNARQTNREGKKGRYIMNDTVFEFILFYFFFLSGGPDTGGTLFL